MAKTTKTTEPNDQPTSDEAQDIRTPGDGARMLSARELEAIHGKEALEENVRKAEETRARNGR